MSNHVVNAVDSATLGERGQGQQPQSARSPEDILGQAQEMLRDLQSQSQFYHESHTHFAQEARRFEVLASMMAMSIVTETNDYRARRVVPEYTEHMSRMRDKEREIRKAHRSRAYYQNASERMRVLYASVDAEIERLAQEIDDITNGRPLPGRH